MKKTIIDQLLEWTQQRIEEKTAMRERFSKLLLLYQNQLNFRIIKIAGTNGKGSTSAMLSACLTSDNQTVGLFTSPHLVHVSERFRVNDQMIDTKELETIAKEVQVTLKAFVAKEGSAFIPSFFEVLILIAICFFYKKKVKIAIFEAGIGGKNDAVSLLPDVLSAITSIGLDHEKQLGGTLKSVATDKAGIALNHSTLWVQSTIPNALHPIIQENVNEGVSVFFTKEKVKPHAANSTDFFIKINEQQQLVTPQLQGSFQLENLNLAANIFDFLYQKKLIHNLKSIKGIEQTQWQARFERIGQSPEFLVDAAHNEHALQALVIALNRINAAENRVLVIGISSEKDRKKMAYWLPKLAQTIYLVDDFYKATSAKQLLQAFSSVEVSNTNGYEMQSVLAEVKATYSKELIVLTGSIFMIGKARELIVQEI